MNNRWDEVDSLFHDALARPISQRADFLDAVCGSDTRLRFELGSLLDHHDRADAFLEVPATIDLSEPAADGAAPPLTGATLGHYDIGDEIGRGGMGVVYAARDTRLGRVVALKVLAPRWTEDARSRERLRREARSAAALSHPGIATIFALEEFDGHVFLVSELVDGETLRSEISRDPLAPDRVASTAIELARALAAAHAAGVIHRDLKPENVIRTAAGLKVIDFGLAILEDGAAGAARLTEPDLRLGTPAYMAPEQLRGERVDARADQFAFGTMTCELANGDGSFDTAALPASIAPIIRRCLQPCAGDRFATTSDLVAALESAAPGTPHTALRLWWWQAHQLIASAISAALLPLLWFVRPWLPDGADLIAFFGSLIFVIVAVTLRLHLWFSSFVYPEEWDAARRRSGPWIRAADRLFAAFVLLTGIEILVHHPGTAIVFIAASVALTLASTVIEPATERAAFRP